MQRNVVRRAVRPAPASRTAHRVESLEPRVLLAAWKFPFLAANFSHADIRFEQQPASGDNLREVNVEIPPGFEFQLPEFHYEPTGVGEARFDWPEAKQMTRPDPRGGEAVAFANSGATLNANLGSTRRPATLDTVMQDIVAGYAAGGDGWTTLRAPGDDEVIWTIAGGSHNGKNLRIKGLSASFRKVNLNDQTFQWEDRATEFVFPAGYAPNGELLVFHVAAAISTSVITSNPEVISLADAANDMLAAASVRSFNDRIIDGVESNVKFSGAMPDTLMFYDFSADATPHPDDVRYVGQYDQASLPVRFGIHGGNACGTSSTTMLLEILQNPRLVDEVYNRVMEIGLNVASETPQQFRWDKGRNYIGEVLGGSHTVLACWEDTWANVEANLKAHKPVLVGTDLGQGTDAGKGHVLLMLGVGTNPDVKAGLKQLYANASGEYYIVADPAGHYFGDHLNGTFNDHYGPVNGLRLRSKGINYGGWFAVYPKEELQSRVSPVRTITISPVAPAADVTVHSPVTVVITDPLGRRTGILPDGSVLDEIPDGNYQVAVGEEFGSNTRTFDPEREKGVVLSTPLNGTYRVELVGTGSGPFTLNINLLVPGAGPHTTTYTGTVSPGGVYRYSFGFPPSSAPAVERVYLSGSSWTPAFKQALAALSVGSAQHGFALPADGQLDERPWANANQVSITFDRDVVVDANDLRITGVNTPVYTLDPAGFTFLATTRTATWRLAGGRTFRNDRILLDLDGDGPNGVKTAAGAFLDGDWINPVGAAAGGDAYPSGDGTPGGDFRFRFNVLAADADLNGIVNAADVVATRARQGAGTAVRLATASILHDIDGDGVVNLRDTALVRLAHGTTLPAGTPAPASALAPLARRQPPVRTLLFDAP